MRKLTAVLLTGIITAGLVAGCGASGEQAQQSASQTEEAASAGNAEQGENSAVTDDASASEGASSADAANADNAEAAGTVSPGTEIASEEEIVPEGAVFNIYCIGEDFKSRVQDYFPDYELTGDDSGMIGQTRVRWHVYSDVQEYRDELDEMLDEQTDQHDEGGPSAMDADERIDLFVVDEAFLADYVESEYSLDVIGKIGIAPEELSDQFPYTQEMATDSEGRLKAVTWQATPGVFAYRRSIARRVLGTDDPQKVQEAVADWEKFAETAEAAKENGYYMLSGFEDAYQVYADNVSSAWVEDGTLNIDPHLEEWAEQTREFYENDYTHGTAQWSDEWRRDHTGDGEVFGFFYSSWGIQYTLQNKAEGENGSEEEEEESGEDSDVASAAGDYAVCMGPEPSHFGGQWIIAAAGGDNRELAGQVMRTLTCDPVLMKKITEEIREFTNTVSGMEELAQSDYKVKLLGRQNPLPVYVESARRLSKKHTTAYDDDLSLGFKVTMQDYITGKASLEDTLDLFRKTALARYEELEEPEED